jgi:hypothetical protein
MAAYLKRENMSCYCDRNPHDMELFLHISYTPLIRGPYALKMLKFLVDKKMVCYNDTRP